MKYVEADGGVILSGYNSFDIGHTLECGQVFRFEKLAFKDYLLIAHGKVLRVKQENDITYFYPCNIAEFENIWLDYFDLNRDYEGIKQALSDGDEVMKNAVRFGGGIRILNQEKIEMIISFIISQNNKIPRIQKIIQAISEKYGEKIGGYFAFPSIGVLSKISEAEFAQLKAGFRAKYLADAAKKLFSGEIELNPPSGTTTDEIRNNLMQINGVGPKVANCILLFSYGRRESFPVDVWVKRALEEFYFPQNNMSNAELEKWASAKFGEYGGYAQQYLFYYMRSAGGR
jgi:N-glycosylase/DNA lyase